MKKATLKIKNNFPEVNEIIQISPERPKGGDYLAWVKSGEGVTDSKVLAEVAATLYRETGKYYPRPEQMEARAYFMSQLLDKQLEGHVVLKELKVNKCFINNTPEFRLRVFVGTHEEVVAFDKKHFPYKDKVEPYLGHCYPESRKELCNLFCVIKITNKKGKPVKPETIITTILHEMLHAVDSIGNDHSNLDYYTRGVLFKHLVIPILEELGFTWED
jgi:hypothetical protein